MSNGNSDRGPGDVPVTGAGRQTSGQQSSGALLAAGRQAKELTLDEVGDALNLSPQTVTWLETDDFDALPAPAFTQGYIRNYAKYVDIDPDLVVSAYQGLAGKPDVSWESPRGNAGFTELIQRHPGMLISLVVAAVVLLIVIVLAVVWPDDDEAVEPDPEIGLEVAPNRGDQTEVGETVRGGDPQESTQDRPAETSSDTTSDTTSEGTAPQRADIESRGDSLISGSARFDDPNRSLDRDAIDPNDPLAHLPVAKTYPVGTFTESSSEDASSSDESSSEETSVPQPRARRQEVDPSPAFSPVTEARGPTGKTINRRLTAAGNNVIRVEVVEDCWIAIKNVDDKELYSTLAREGQTLNLTGQGPFQVLLGYAPGASLYLDDRQILLDPYTRNNVAKLVIGQ